MKKIPALLLICVLLLQQMCFINVGAEEKKIITLTGLDYVSGTPAEIGKSNPYAMVRNGNVLGYTVDLPSEVMTIKLIYRTGAGEQGNIEVRKDNAGGPLLAELDTKALGNDVWADYTCVITLPEPMVGENTIYVKGLSGSHWIASLSFIPFDNSKRFVKYGVSDNFGDIANDPNGHEINLLSDLELIKKDGVEFNPEKFMSRIDFVSILGRVLEADKCAVPETSIFKDVGVKDENAALLNGLYQLGIIKGGTDGNFRPHDFITPLEVATVCANASGYSGYKNALEIARHLEIFDGISLKSNTITRSEGAKIIYNLLLADFPMVDKVGSNYISYKQTENFLKINSKYAHGVGVMTANNVTELYLRENRECIVIDGIEYRTEKHMTPDFLGINCEFFYREENYGRILSAIRPHPRTEVNVIESDENIAFDIISERELVYTIIDEDEEVEYELNSATAIIYNATALDTNLIKLIPNPSEFEGRITTIDNNGDGVLEAIWIDQISHSIKVEAIAGTKIKDEFTQTFYDTAKGEFTCFTGDRTAELDELSAGDVLSIYESSDNGTDKIIRAIKNENEISGRVAMVNNGIYYTINDAKYKASSKCREDIYLGLTGTFTINEYGFIVSCEQDKATDNNVGALLAYTRPKSNDLTPVAKLKLLTEDGIEIFNVAKKVKADGVLVKSVNEFYNGVGGFAGILNISTNTPVVYSLNANNEVSKIDTVADGVKNDDDKLFCFVEESANEEGGYRFRNDTFITKDTYKAKYGASTSIKYITISPDKEENSKITNGYAGSIHTPRALGIYSTRGESLLADLVISSGVAAREYDSTAKPFMFKSVSAKMDNDDGVVHCINGVSSSAEVSYDVDPDAYESLKDLIDSLKDGDIVDGTMKNSMLVSLSLVYIPNATDIKEIGPTANAAGKPTILNVNTRTTSYNDDDDTNNKERIYYLAKVVDTEENFAKLNCQVEGDQPGELVDSESIYNTGSTKVAIIEKSDRGGYAITSGLSATSLVKDDLVIAINAGGGGEVLTSIYVFRDSSR